MPERSKKGRRGRPATAILAALTISVAVMAPAAARADIPMGGAPPVDGYVTSTGTGEQGTTPSDGRVNVAPPQGAEGSANGAGQQPPTGQPQPGGQPPAAQGQQPAGNAARPGAKTARGRLRTTCRTRRSTHTRTCRTYRGSHLIKVCTRKRGKRQRCHSLLHAASADPGPEIRMPELVKRARAMAHLAGYLTSGWVDPVAAGVVRLYSTSSSLGDHGWCSGSMIARGLVLTAAHCVFDDGEEDHQQAHWYPYRNGALQVVPGDRASGGRSSYPYGVWNVHEVFAPPAYTKQFGTNDDTLDWAILQLEPDANGGYAGDSTGTFSATWGKNITTNTQVWSAGYPASGLFNQASYAFGENQFYCNATPDRIATQGAARVLQYPCKGTGGISGGPVWARSDDGSWTIVAVHNRGSKQGDPNLYYGKDAFNYWMDNRFGQFWTSTIAYIRSH